MSRGAETPQPPARRLDQWLWFARFAKSRSLAARHCAAGTISVNGVGIKKANHLVRVGDVVALVQGPWRRRVRIMALGQRRGPAIEARTLYDDIDAPSYAAAPAPEWVPLLGDE